MAINLAKYRDELTSAREDVLNDKTDTDWALFGYDGLSNDLKFLSKGSNGIEEMSEDLNNGKIMYAFLKINDPKTSLPKCVLINWQGEGANTVRKGICANHLRDLEKFFTGANLTITARNDEEVEPQLIIDKVAKAGSSYSFKAPRGDHSESRAPVGSSYKRINPVQEINAVARDQFWLKEEQEEKRRVEEERKLREEAKLKLEEEIRKRDELEAKKREEITIQRDKTIDKIKEAEKSSVVVKKVVVQEEERETNEQSINQSDVMRQQRNAEAQNLIAQRTIDARSIFEQNTSAGQIKRIPEKPVRASLLKAQQQQQHKQESDSRHPEVNQNEQVLEVSKKIAEEQSDEEDQFATIKRSPKDLDKKNSVTSPIIEHQEIMQQQKNGSSDGQTAALEQATPITEQQFVDQVIYGDIDTGIKAQALYDYQAADDTEITIDPGDIITHIEMVDEGWWQGLAPDGSYGLFPANYVELI